LSLRARSFAVCRKEANVLLEIWHDILKGTGRKYPATVLQVWISYTIRFIVWCIVLASKFS